MPTDPIRVVGMSFRPTYPENLHLLSELQEEARAGSIRSASSWSDIDADSFPGLPVILVREPDNQYDANAIEVHVPALGRRQFVGHIPRDLAARWAPRMDGGNQVTEAYVSAIPIDPAHLEKPGLEIAVRFHLGDCAIASAPDERRCTCRAND